MVEVAKNQKPAAERQGEMSKRAVYSRRRREPHRVLFCHCWPIVASYLAAGHHSWSPANRLQPVVWCQERPAFKWLCAGPWTVAVLPGRRFAASCVLGGPGSHTRDIACWLASPVTLEGRADRRVVSRLPDIALGALRTTHLLVLLWLSTLVFLHV